MMDDTKEAKRSLVIDKSALTALFGAHTKVEASPAGKSDPRKSRQAELSRPSDSVSADELAGKTFGGSRQAEKKDSNLQAETGMAAGTELAQGAEETALPDQGGPSSLTTSKDRGAQLKMFRLRRHNGGSYSIVVEQELLQSRQPQPEVSKEESARGAAPPQVEAQSRNAETATLVESLSSLDSRTGEASSDQEHLVREDLSASPVDTEVAEEIPEAAPEPATSSKPALKEANPTDEPENPVAATHQQAESALRQGNLDEAVEAFRAVLAEQPDCWPAHFNLGLCLEKQERYHEARESFQRATDLMPNRWEALLGLANCLVRQGEDQRAFDIYCDVLEMASDQRSAQFGKAVTLHRLGRFDEALRCYEVLLESDGENEEILSNIASVHFSRKDRQSARQVSERLLELVPQSEVALRILSELCSGEADEENAAKWGAHLADVSPGSFDVWYNLALACQRTGRLEVAVDAYKKALEVNPESAKTLNNLGCVYHEMEDFSSARSSYEASLRLDADHPGACWNLALVTEAQGLFQEAEKHYAVVVRRQPGWKEADSRLRRLRPA